MRKRHLLAVITTLFLTAAVVYYIASVDVSERVSPERDYRPSFIGSGLSTSVLDENGKLSMTVKAGRMEYFRVSDTMYYDHPRIFRRMDDGSKIGGWELTADQGHFNSGEFVSVSGNVVLESRKADGTRPESGSGGQWRLETPYLQFDLNTHDISADKGVRITGSGGSSNSCCELAGNPDTRIFSMKRNCNAVIYPEDFDGGS